MADFNGGSPPSRTENQQKLPDLLILEIIERLPLEQATRCSLLNRNLRRCIARPECWRRHAASSSRAATIFRCSATYPKNFTRFRNEICSESTVTLERETSIIASCNGILLLCYTSNYERAYSVFNPITGGVKSVKFPVNPGSSVALAIDSDDDDSLFKVVTADVAATEPDWTVVRISILEPGPDRSMSLKNRAKLVSRRRFTVTAADYNVRPVYAAGTLYWLGHDARVTVAFDLVKQRGRVTDGPVNGENRTGDMWFDYAACSSTRCKRRS